MLTIWYVVDAFPLVAAKAAPRGMRRTAAEAFRQVSLPFFTTKATGSGIDLTLCREAIRKHRGRCRLARRPRGGMAISFWLPGRGATATAAKVQARLSLTRT